jgi:hypothetical protein
VSTATQLDAQLALAVTLEVRRAYLERIFGTSVHWSVNTIDPETIVFEDEGRTVLELHQLDGERLRRAWPRE